MSQRLLITGGSGYLGRHIARRVAGGWPGEWRYTTFSADPLALPQGARLDLRDGAAVARFVADFAPDAVIHTAGSNLTPDMAAVIIDSSLHGGLDGAQSRTYEPVLQPRLAVPWKRCRHHQEGRASRCGHRAAGRNAQ